MNCSDLGDLLGRHCENFLQETLGAFEEKYLLVQVGGFGNNVALIIDFPNGLLIGNERYNALWSFIKNAVELFCAGRGLEYKRLLLYGGSSLPNRFRTFV